MGVDGSQFKILGTKLFNLQIGSTIKTASFSIPERGTELIIGLDLLKLFNISMHFSSNINIYCNDEFIKAESIEIKNEIISTNINKCVLYPKSCRSLTLQNDDFKDNLTYLSYSHADYASIVIPSTAVSKNGKLNIVLKNDSNKKQTIKANVLKIVTEMINPEDIYSINNETAKNLILDSEILPVPFYNKNCEFNKGYYKNIKENMIRINFLNNIFDIDNKEENLEESKDTLEYLSQLPGLALPDIKFPIKSSADIVDEYLKDKYTENQRTFLKKEFEKYPELVSRYSYDYGKMKDIQGNLITMNIPLKEKLPIMTKTYKLSPNERKAKNDILDFIIHYNLAENADINNITGSPCFLVGRPDKNRGHRIIFDVREVNKYVKSPVSTYTDCVTTPLKTSKYDFLTCVDLRSAYYAISLSRTALDSNISQVITDDRCVRFYSPLTGSNSVPLFFTNTINKQMNVNDAGLYDPLSTPNSFLKHGLTISQLRLRGMKIYTKNN